MSRITIEIDDKKRQDLKREWMERYQDQDGEGFERFFASVLLAYIDASQMRKTITVRVSDATFKGLERCVKEFGREGETVEQHCAMMLTSAVECEGFDSQE